MQSPERSLNHERKDFPAVIPPARAPKEERPAAQVTTLAHIEGASQSSIGLRLSEDLFVGVQVEAFRRVGQRSATGITCTPSASGQLARHCLRTPPPRLQPCSLRSCPDCVSKRGAVCRELRFDQVAGRSPWTAPASQRPRPSARGVIGWRFGCLAELAESLLPPRQVVVVPGASVQVWVWQGGRPVPRVTP